MLGPAVFKGFLDRTKDRADLEEVVASGVATTSRVLGVIVTYLGGADERVEPLRMLGPPWSPS